jgi:hypothetical protein
MKKIRDISKVLLHFHKTPLKRAMLLEGLDNEQVEKLEFRFRNKNSGVFGFKGLNFDMLNKCNYSNNLILRAFGIDKYQETMKKMDYLHTFLEFNKNSSLLMVLAREFDIECLGDYIEELKTTKNKWFDYYSVNRNILYKIRY